MKSRCFLLVLLCVLLASGAKAQVNCSSPGQVTSMACLVPNNIVTSNSGYSYVGTSLADANTTAQNLQALQQVQRTFTFLNTAMGGELSQVPLASPASGLVFTFDKATGIQGVSSDTLGPVLTQRAQTIGKGKFFLAFTYQYFEFKDIDGISMKHLPIVFPLYVNGGSANYNQPDAYAVGNTTIDLNVNQHVGYLTYGLSQNTDISIAVPVLSLNERLTSAVLLYNYGGSVVPDPSTSFGCASSSFAWCQSVPKSVTGVGDIILASKTKVASFHSGGLSVGAEVRLPTGDAHDYLGSGTVGVKPFATVSTVSHLGYHLILGLHGNVGFQANGSSILGNNRDHLTSSGQLPNRVIYSSGFDFGLGRQITISADVIAQYVINAPRAVEPCGSAGNSSCLSVGQLFPAGSGVSNVFATNYTTTRFGSYTRVDGSGGVKIKPFRTHGLIFTGNVVTALNSVGLRARIIPLVGGSWTF